MYSSCLNTIGIGRASRRSAHVKSTVHIEHVAGDITCHRGREEERCVYNLTYITKTSERDLFDEALHCFLGHALAHADVYETRRDCIHGDVLPGKLARRNFGERDNARFAR